MIADMDLSQAIEILLWIGLNVDPPSGDKSSWSPCMSNAFLNYCTTNSGCMLVSQDTTLRTGKLTASLWLIASFDLRGLSRGGGGPAVARDNDWTALSTSSSHRCNVQAACNILCQLIKDHCHGRQRNQAFPGLHFAGAEKRPEGSAQ